MNINIHINPEIIDHTFENNTFTFKKDGKVIKEFTLPEDCNYLLGKGTDICFKRGLLEYFFSSGPLKIPHYIPEGYSNLKIDYDLGLYSVQDKQGRHAHYIDTSKLTPEDFIKYNSTYHIKQEQIPKEGFWLILKAKWEDYNFTLFGTSTTHKSIPEINEWLNKYLPHCKLINEAEFMACDTYNHMNYPSVLSAFLPEGRIMIDDALLITPTVFRFENWDVIATKVNEPNNYILFNMDLGWDGNLFSYTKMDYPYDYEKAWCNYVFPVIDEERQKQYKK